MSRFVEVLSPFCTRLDEVRTALRWAKAAQTRTDLERRVGQEINAASFVAISGAVEQFFRRFVEYLAQRVTEEKVALQDVRLSIHSLVSSDEFRSLQSLRDREKIFGARLALLTRTHDSEPCRVSIRHDELGLGGESIRPTQVEMIWRIFGLPPPAFKSIRQDLALRIVADNRNDFAHGQVSVSQFLQNPECEIDQIIVRLGDIEDWSFHCWEVADHYFGTSGFFRS